MLAYETNNSVEMVDKIQMYQGVSGKYLIYFNKDGFYKQFSTKEEAQIEYDELRKLFYNKELKIIKG